MPPAPSPSDEAGRLAALRAVGILDTPGTEVFDSFVRVARGLFDTPIAAISLIDADRHWFKAIEGLPVSEIPRDISFCAHTILRPSEVLCVPDTLADPRFADNPLVTGKPGIRFYAGAPILNETGHALGALCVIDRRPRRLDQVTLDRLQDLATGVGAAIRLHGTLRRLEIDARSDALTGLGNRREFEATLQRLATEGASLFLLDLDNFKGINDVFGHPGGDQTLQEIARRLRATGRAADHAFRLGGDEFALVVPGVPPPGAKAAIAARIHAALAAPFAIDGEAVPLRTSIGVAAMPQDATTPARLVQRADVALYEAKRAGRGMTRLAMASARTAPDGPVPWPGRRLVARRVGLMDLAGRLRQALVPPGREPFALVFQPVINLRTGRTASLEALVRWNPEPGLGVPPSEFVILAERLGLISHLDRWVLRAACRAAVAWPEPWLVSVNLSAVSFGLIDVAALVRDSLAESGLPAARLTIEMTETALAGDAEAASRAVKAIRKLGAGVALDDFGGGHGTLAALRHFAFTALKIDRALTADVAADATQARMVGLVADLGRALGIEVVAEGVETTEQLRRVSELGVTCAQGYVLARPTGNERVAAAVRDAEAGLRAMVAPEPVVG